MERAAYDARVDAMRAELAALPAGSPVRLRKPTSNLFRPRGTAPAALDASGLSGVLALDLDAMTADVLGMTTYEDLVDTLLPHGVMPMVVPELKTITLGGAVTGLGIESTSYRNGCPHESVLELDVLTGAGDIVTAAAGGEHRDLFYGFPNSYGSLGYALRLRIALEPVAPYVHLRHVHLTGAEAAAVLIEQICATGQYDEQPVAFLDGVWFDPEHVTLTVGSWADETPRRPSTYLRHGVYWHSVRDLDEDWLTVRDYLWRWDPDWFWCSRALGAQNPTLRRLWPQSKLRSDVYWKAVAFERRYGVMRRIDAARGRPAMEWVIQDVEVPVAALPDFLGFLDRQTGMNPVWLCPLRQRDAGVSWDLYALDPATTYVNVGFWGGVALPAGAAEPFHNRAIEREVARLGGRKSLYSTAFYPEDEFWSTYGGETYQLLKKTYDPDNRLLDLYAKTVGRR